MASRWPSACGASSPSSSLCKPSASKCFPAGLSDTIFRSCTHLIVFVHCTVLTIFGHCAADVFQSASCDSAYGLHCCSHHCVHDATVKSCCNNCFCFQGNSACNELSLLRGAIAARMQCLVPNCLVLTSRMCLH